MEVYLKVHGSSFEYGIKCGCGDDVLIGDLDYLRSFYTR
jgi:hypothetical protein